MGRGQDGAVMGRLGPDRKGPENILSVRRPCSQYSKSNSTRDVQKLVIITNIHTFNLPHY